MKRSCAFIDADLIGRKNHRFPNLALMKIAGYEMALGSTVVLKLDYVGLDEFDHVFISKVFTATPVPEAVLQLPNVTFGGTGFFYDLAPALPVEIEHHTPLYSLYEDFVAKQVVAGVKKLNLAYYTDYSIGFLTRGCFRGCAFCVNRNSVKSSAHSPLVEFFDPTRPKICLLDDNFFACADWRQLMDELQASNRLFQFKQGLDERLLTPAKVKALFESKTTGDLIFAFDNYEDKPIIEAKLNLIRSMYPESKKTLKFYCFTGFDRDDVWDKAFWIDDVFTLFERIRILMSHRAIPYVMRHERYEGSPYRGMYITLARWANQPSIFKKMTFREFVTANGENSSAFRYAAAFEAEFPATTQQYYDMRYPT